MHVRVNEDQHKGKQAQVNEYDDSCDEDEVHPENELGEAPNKTPNRYMQKNHPEEKIMGNKNDSLQTRRRLSRNNEQVNLCLMTEMEPKTFKEASKSDKWMDAMEEELQQIEKNKT